MITIVEPKEYINKLWGKQRIQENETYRLMKYVLRADYDDRVILHNVVTGHLVVLEQEEEETFEKLPNSFSSVMKALVDDHFLVPEEYDEHQQVVNLRTILSQLETNKTRPITGYTILPTTACNARCYYCFEQDVKSVTMTKQTANEVIDFILSHCGDKKNVSIIWFGGEPTVAAHRIDQISAGLHKNGISFSSTMITNGYLFDEEMVERAVKVWNLRGLQICVDGTENSYNKIKAFVGTNQNAYQRVMRNIELLLRNNIRVGLRMNFDLDNYYEFEKLLEDALKRFGRDENLNVSAFPIIGAFPNPDGIVHHGSDEWLAEKRAELCDLSSSYGLRHYTTKLPFLNLQTCAAYNDGCVTIRPDGGLVRCPELFEDIHLIGDIKNGITNLDLVSSWKKIADYDFCKCCVLFPNCLRLVNCRNKSFCVKVDDLVKQCVKQMVEEYKCFAF